MGRLRPDRFSLCLVFLLALALGCQVLYRYRPVPVLVRDAETKKPIANADVHLYYPLSRDSLAPFDSSDRTDADGVAHLRAAPYGDFGVRIEASAPGYLTDQADVSSESIQHLQPPHFFKEKQQRKPFVVEMYAEPRFSVELMVPAGYRGPIKAEIEPQEDVAVPPGQRCFRYEVVDGFVRIKGPAFVLRRVYPSDYRASYSDGTPLTAEMMTLQKVGFRWLRGQDKEQYFVVGTQPEYDMQRRYASDEETVEQRAARLRRIH